VPEKVFRCKTFESLHTGKLYANVFLKQWQATVVVYEQIALNQSARYICESSFAKQRWSYLVKVTFESRKLSKEDASHEKIRFRKLSFWSLSKENFPM